jgi:DNA-binding transcriptional LysR family regulator
MAADVRNGREPTIAAVAATYEAETTFIARGMGISFTSTSVARFYQRPGIVYVPVTGRPAIPTTLAWNPSALSQEADALVRHVRTHWGSGGGEDRGGC